MDTTIVVIGSGFAGISIGVRLKQAGIPFIILERAQDVGGTWRDNTYPGCACDTQSHHYCLSFEPNPDWPEVFSGQPHILEYLRHCARKYGLMDHIRFGQSVAAATYDEASATWSVETESGDVLTCRAVVSAVGLLNTPYTPDLPGREKFKGAAFHTAEWDHDYDMTGKRVAVIGNAASALQLIPEVAKEAAQLSVFQRSANWVAARGNRAYKAWEKWMFRYVPLANLIYRYRIYWMWERSWPEFLIGTRQAEQREADYTAHIHQDISDPELAAALTPDYEVGCKRVLLADNYYPAFNRDNVSLVTSGIERMDETGLVTKDGRHHDADAIVYATGFKSQEFLASMKITGRAGRDLHDTWKEGAEAYLGISVSGFPNLFVMYGPNTNLGHNSIVFMIESQTRYVMKCLKKLVSGGRQSMEVREDAMQRFNQQLQKDLEKTAWAGGCGSWYKNASGRITTNWSTYTATYWLKTFRPRFSDYLIR